MNVNYKSLGKVSVTANGYWNRNKRYERISIVTDEVTNRSYIAKQDVPVGIHVTNTEYWQEISATGFKSNNIIILSDICPKTGKVKTMTLKEAISSINVKDRRAGLILGFYGENHLEVDAINSWFLYQFNSNTVDDWCRLECWQSIYDNIEKFKGYFIDEAFLFKQFPYPVIGDFAFVGDDLENANVYICTSNGTWRNTLNYALEFANKFKAVHSHDFGEFKTIKDKSIADMAIKDALGQTIHDTYVTIEWLNNTLMNNGTTCRRPNFRRLSNIGYQYFDTTLNKPIWWNGKRWVDANGEEV